MHRTALISMVMMTFLAGAAMADWPQFLGPTGNGVAAPGEAKLAEKWPDGGPKVLWTVTLGRGFGGPAIRDGKVYLLDRVGNEKDVLRCLDLATGTEQWNCSYPAGGRKFGYHGTRSTPAVDDKHVFSIGMYGHLHCVDKATHKSVWSKDLLADYEGRIPNWGVAISPLLYKDRVIVAALGKTAGVIAYEKATGKELWRSRPMGRMAYVSPIILKVDGADQLVVLPDGGARVAGLDAANGKLLWTFRSWKCNIPIAAPTDCGDGCLFVTGGYKAGSVMLKIAKQDGKFTAREVFRLDDIGSILHNALVHKGHLYVNANTKRTFDGLMCVDLAGKIKWQTGRQPNCEKGSLILAGGLIYIMDGKSGLLRMVRPDPTHYAEIGQVKILGARPVWAPMAVSGGKLICRDQRQMKCLDITAPAASLRPPRPPGETAMAGRR